MRVLVVTPWWSKTPWVQTQVQLLRAQHDVHVVEVDECVGQPRWWATLRTLWDAWGHYEFKWKPDVVHSYGAWPAGVAGRLIAWGCAVPHVVHEHLSPPERLRKLPLALAVLRDAFRVVCPSPRHAVAVGNLCERPCVVVQNPVAFPPQIRVKQVPMAERKRLIVGVGRNVHQKGWDRVIGAMRYMPEDVRLVLVGARADGERPWPMSQSNIEWYPWTTHEEALGWICAAEVVVCPSRHESFGMVAAEASRLRKKVLATNVGAQAQHASFILEQTDDPRAWAEAMKFTLAMEDYVPERFHMDDIQFAARFTELYEAVPLAQQGA